MSKWIPCVIIFTSFPVAARVIVDVRRDWTGTDERACARRCADARSFGASARAVDVDVVVNMMGGRYVGYTEGSGFARDGEA